MANSDPIDTILCQAQSIASSDPDEAVLTLVGSLRDHLGEDGSLTPYAAKAVLAEILGVPSAELREISAAGSSRAVERLVRLARRLNNRVTTDDLTGALLRGAGLEAAAVEVSRARRAGGSLVAAMVDADGLKRINDTRGHAAGDAFLRCIVTCLRGHLRDYDILLRYGGDEFVCVLPGAAIADAQRRFEDVRRAVLSGCGGSVSFGLATLENDDTVESLVARADQALYSQRRVERS